MHDLDSDHPRISYTDEDGSHEIECDFIAGCDGFHGICRPAIPDRVLKLHDFVYDFGWLGILAHAAPATDELIYAWHDNGFALYSMRSPVVSRLYLQVPADEDIGNWPDERIWEELQRRMAREGWQVNEGEVFDKGITPMRSFVCEPMQYGRLFLAGDAAHIVPPTGAKGLNLAVNDARLLAQALTEYYRGNSGSALERYTDDAAGAGVAGPGLLQLHDPAPARSRERSVRAPAAAGAPRVPSALRGGGAQPGRELRRTARRGRLLALADLPPRVRIRHTCDSVETPDDVRFIHDLEPSNTEEEDLHPAVVATRDQSGAEIGAERMPEELNTGHLLRRLVALGLLIAVVVLAIDALPGLGDLRSRFARATALLVALTALLEIASMLAYVVTFRDIFCRRMPWRLSYDIGMAEQAANVLVPTGGAGGLALGAWALHQGGMKTEHIARRTVAFFVLTSLPNFACAALIGPLLLTGVVSAGAPSAVTAVLTAGAWAIVVLVALLPRLLRRFGPDSTAGQVAGKLRTFAAALVAGLRDTGELLRGRRWPAILGSIGYLAFDIAALAASFAAFGSVPQLLPLVFAYVVGQLGGLIPIPAGIGGTDGGLIGALVLYGSPLAQTTAAVLAYRAFQVGIPAIAGTVAFIRLRAELSNAEEPAAACAPLAEHPAAVVELPAS